MKKYGEIERFYIEDLLYIFKVEKWDDHPFQEINIPYFDIAISNKSSKKKRTGCKDFKYSLLNEGFQSYKTIKRIEQSFKDYLTNYKPEYLAISAFQDDRNIFYKRIAFYEQRLIKLGYKFTGIINNEWEDPVYYFEEL